MDDDALLLGQAWAALTGGPLEQPAPEIVGAPGSLPSTLPCDAVATTTVAVALLAAAALGDAAGEGHRRVSLDRRHVAAAVRSERYFQVDRRAVGGGFAPLSGFWRAADGWVRTHANYPWHRASLLGVLGVRDPDPEAVAAAIATWPAAELEEQVFARGGVAARVRSDDEWSASPPGRAVAAEPLIAHAVEPGADARAGRGGSLPAAGLRVLDLTRVIAGPVCTRFLGALGADVLRLDPPHLPDLEPGHPGDTLLGKRSAALNVIADPDGHERLHELLDAADVLVCGYRPSALQGFGLGADELARRHPGLVTVRLAAWGHTGPWAARRGFDSVVQAASGIAVAESGDRAVADLSVPAALPCQLLDHGTGYLAAAAALDGVRRQRAEGGTHTRLISLARTARWLLDAPRSGRVPEPDPSSWTTTLDSARGPITAVAPPGRLDGVALAWPARVTDYLDDEAAWRD